MSCSANVTLLLCGSGSSLVVSAGGTSTGNVSIGGKTICEDTSITVMASEGYFDNAVFVTHGGSLALTTVDGKISINLTFTDDDPLPTMASLEAEALIEEVCKVSFKITDH